MKQIPPDLLDHIRGEVTSLCTMMEVRRRDGASFHFTDHDEPVLFSLLNYVPWNSFARSSIQRTIDLEVDGMEINAILNSSGVSQIEVAQGLFDFSEITVFMVNWMDTSLGRVIVSKGWLGEVTTQEDGSFFAEQRGLSQAYTTRIGESYAPECRADLGDRRCKVPLNPDTWRATFNYRKGDVVVGHIDAAHGFVNLPIVNGNFADDPGGTYRDLTGWTTYGDAKGRWVIATSYHGDLAKFGTSAYSTDSDTGHSSDFGMYQDIDLEGAGLDPYDLDTGLCRIYSTLWYLRLHDKGQTRFRIIALDAGGAQVGMIWDSGVKANAEDRWFQDVITDKLIPAGTRVLRFDLWGNHKYGVDYGIAFDELTASVNSPSGTLGNADQFGGVAFQANNTGVSGSTEPAFSNLLGSTTTDGTVTWTAVKAWKVTTEVDSVTDGKTFVPIYLSEADGYYDGGLLIWETGRNAGRAQEIKTWASGQMQLFYRPFFTIQPGDRAVVHPGCDKRRETCRDKFSNIVNMRAEPDVPGQDAYYATPNAPPQ